MSGGVQVALERPDQPDVVRLIDALDAYQKPLYPIESFHGIDMDALLRPDVLFAVARVAGAAVGCGAVVVDATAGWGEIKRMFVAPSVRGRGIGRAVIGFLERQARDRGCAWLRLETGISQPEALGLYAREGYVRRGPFAGYAEDPLSVFMEKRLAP